MDFSETRIEQLDCLQDQIKFKFSDINLLNKPGIQNNTIDNKYSNVKEEKSLNNNKDNQPSAHISTMVTTKRINYF